ncbi:unnamed protein product, partial [Didymodactylos carnosus]
MKLYFSNADSANYFKGSSKKTSEPATVALVTATQVNSSALCSEFYMACRANNVNAVQKMLETITVDDIDQMEPNGSTALHVACYNGHIEIVQLLLDANADRSIMNKYKCLPFDEAATEEIKELFLRAPNSNRLVSNTGAIEWDLVDDEVAEKAAEDQKIIKSLFSSASDIDKMFDRIEKNYI